MSFALAMEIQIIINIENKRKWHRFFFGDDLGKTGTKTRFNCELCTVRRFVLTTMTIHWTHIFRPTVEGHKRTFRFVYLFVLVDFAP